MCEGQREQVGMIRRGEIDYYFPVVFQTDLSYIELYEAIEERISVDIENHLYELQANIHESVENYQNTRGKHASLKVSDHLMKKAGTRRLSLSECNVNQADKTVEFQVFSTERGFGLEMITAEQKEYKRRHLELDEEYKENEKYYGMKYAMNQRRILLLPLRVKLASEVFVWLNGILYVFPNKMGVLKLELPLVNVTSQPLKEYKYDKYIKEINNTWRLAGFNLNNEIEQVFCAYADLISDVGGIKLSQQEGMFRHVIMADFEGQPEQIEIISDDIQEELYRIIAAPVSERKCTSYKPYAKTYIEKHSWDRNNVKYIMSTNGGILSICDRKLVNYQMDRLSPKYDPKEVEDSQTCLVHNSMIRDLCMNAEFGIIILLLKKMNATYTYEYKAMNPLDANKVQAEYQRNVMFISELQDNCYGTVSEQLEIFEKMMPYYIKRGVIQERMDALNKLVDDNEKRKQDEWQNRVSILGLLFTAIFGLPAIHESLMIVDKLIDPLQVINLPRITFENIGFIIWGAILVILFRLTGRKN